MAYMRVNNKEKDKTKYQVRVLKKKTEIHVCALKKKTEIHVRALKKKTEIHVRAFSKEKERLAVQPAVWPARKRGQRGDSYAVLPSVLPLFCSPESQPSQPFNKKTMGRAYGNGAPKNPKKFFY